MSDNFLTHRLWLGITRWRWLTIWLVFMFAVIMFSITLVQRNYEKDQQDAIDVSYEACQSRNELITLMRQVITFAVGEPNGTDLTVIAGFEDLDRETQAFLENLRDETQAAEQAAADDPNSFANQSYAVLQPLDCEGQFPDHS